MWVLSADEHEVGVKRAGGVGETCVTTGTGEIAEALGFDVIDHIEIEAFAQPVKVLAEVGAGAGGEDGVILDQPDAACGGGEALFKSLEGTAFETFDIDLEEHRFTADLLARDHVIESACGEQGFLALVLSPGGGDR